MAHNNGSPLSGQVECEYKFWFKFGKCLLFKSENLFMNINKSREVGLASFKRINICTVTYFDMSKS